MEDQRPNPFASYGQILDTEGFIGRTDAINALKARVIEAASPGCVAIVGPPRIGKSSLAYHVLRRPERVAELMDRRLIAVWCNIHTLTSTDQLLRNFVRLVLEQLEDFGQQSARLDTAGQRAAECDNLTELQHQVQRFFRLVTLEGWRTVIVLEEFDAARQVFQQNAIGFQTLRTLADNPEWRVAFVTCSRRSIPEIELQSRADISNFHNIFHYLFLKPFQEDEHQALLERLGPVRLSLAPEELATINPITGRHPYLTSVLCFFLVQSWLNAGRATLDEALQAAQETFIIYYDSLVHLLAEDATLDKMIQLLFGPLINAIPEDAARLVRIGLLRQDADGTYRAFSSHFGEYLRLTERSVDFWPLWTQTERALRGLIASVMTETYPRGDWTEAVEQARPKLKKMLDDCRARMADEQRRFGPRASTSLLDYTYPGDLYQIIRTHWSAFQPTLKQNEAYWELRFDLLARIRNTVAHNRDEVLALDERQTAEGYCREILRRVGGSKAEA